LQVCLAKAAKAGQNTDMMSSADRHPVRLRRSVLCVPADNPRALAKVATLACDAVIYDLEDAVLPDNKSLARETLKAHLAQGRRPDIETVIRINSLASGHSEADLAAVLEIAPDAVLLPKVDTPQDVRAVADFLTERDAPDDIRLWAMIETPHGVLNAAAIAETGRTRGGRLDCLVPGLNDLRKETGVPALAGRTYLVPWLMQILLAARSAGLNIIDAVFNDIRDDAGFEEECGQGRAMGFDGKMLIHPGQIAPANTHFGVADLALAEARSIVQAFAQAGNVDKAVINLNGRMVERLHLEEAVRLVARADAIQQKGKVA
jgi:citrate lyase subunit beta/citryl-CoA lyase